MYFLKHSMIRKSLVVKGKVSSKFKLYTKLNYTKDNVNANITIVRNISRIFRNGFHLRFLQSFVVRPNQTLVGEFLDSRDTLVAWSDLY